MLEEATRNPRAIFVPLNKTISVHGRDVKLIGGIKSLDPPCFFLFQLCKTGERFEEYNSAQTEWKPEKYRKSNWS